LTRTVLEGSVELPLRATAGDPVPPREVGGLSVGRSVRKSVLGAVERA